MQSRRALKFIVLLGIVSLLADITYEGARSAAGPFLAMLGASGRSTLRNVYSINRGYEDIVNRLQKLGASIKVA